VQVHRFINSIMNIFTQDLVLSEYFRCPISLKYATVFMNLSTKEAGRNGINSVNVSD